MNVNAARTAYYLAKFMNTVADFLIPLEEQDSRHYNPTLRKAEVDRKSTRLNASHSGASRMPSSA